MANRRRGAFSLPEELKTNEKLSTKKELALRNSAPTCPNVPSKIKKNVMRNRNLYLKARAVFYLNNVSLSPIYNPERAVSYLDQIYIKYKVLGEGSFGVVYKVRSKEDDQFYAVKRSKSFISFHDRYAEIRNNEKVGCHPNCVQFFMAWEEWSDVFMKLEYCEMSLADYANKDNDICEEMLWNILYDICKALQYLHEKDLVHLDVKPGNIVIKEGYYKLGDFGLLVDLTLDAKKCKSTLSDGDSKYLALEVLEGVYTPGCDIFGLGISLLECAADLELPDHGPLWQQIRHGVLPTVFYDRVSLGLQVLVEKMLLADHMERPAAQKILSYKTLRDVTKKDLKYERTDFARQFMTEDDLDFRIMANIEMPTEYNYNNNLDGLATRNQSGPRRELCGRKSLQFDLEN